MKIKHFRNLRLGKPRRITSGLTDHEHPAMSPDKRHIAYYSGQYGSIQIMVTDIRGRLARRISPYGNNTQPAWHPGGARLAFRHQPAIKDKWEIWEASLFSDNEPTCILADEKWHYKHPSYDPSGRFIAYFSDEGSAGIFHLWLYDTVKEDRLQLTFGDEQNHCHPVFSPDGRRLIFHAYEGTDESRVPPVANLYELTLSTGEIQPLTTGENQCKHPFYLGPDVITYHFEDNTTGIRRLRAMHLPSGEVIDLTTGDNNDKHPFPFTRLNGRPSLLWSSKKLGSEISGEQLTYDVFMARLTVKPQKEEKMANKRDKQIKKLEKKLEKALKKADKADKKLAKYATEANKAKKAEKKAKSKQTVVRACGPKCKKNKKAKKS